MSYRELDFTEGKLSLDWQEVNQMFGADLSEGSRWALERVLNVAIATEFKAYVGARRYWWRVKAEDHSTGVTWSNEVFNFATMRLGDADCNGIVTISDAVYLINYIFASGPSPCEI